MASQLKNILRFVAGGPTTLPHLLNWSDLKVVPDHIEFSVDGIKLLAVDDTNLTINVSADVDVLVESWHTIEREFGDVAVKKLTPQPFIPDAGDIPAVTPGTTVTVYARTTGSDLTGNGTLAAPYRTFQRAVRDVPAVLPPGVRYIVDITGITETLPQDYTLPAWVVPDTLSSIATDPTADPYLTVRMGVTIFAVPQLVAALPAADSVINLADVVANTTDLTMQLRTVEIQRTGTGDSFTFAAGNVTLTDAAAQFTSLMVGKSITITGSTTPANNGTFVITSVNVAGTQATYANAAGVTEAFAGTWVVGTARASWAVTGTGDSLAVTGPAWFPTVTLTDAAGLFTADMVGKPITIAGSTTPANNGTYKVASFISATQITFANPNGVTEAFAGTWQVGLIAGKFTIDAANNTANASIVQNTTSSITITTNQAVTFPLRITEPSASLTGSSLRKGTLAAINIGSIGFVGIKVAPTTPGQQGLYIDTPGWASILLCELDSPGAPPQAGALLPCRSDFNHANWIRNRAHLSSYRSIFFRNTFFDSVKSYDVRGLFSFEGCKSIFFTRCAFDGCEALAPVNHVFTTTRERGAGPVEWWFMNAILVRNCTNIQAAMFFSGNMGFFADVDVYNNMGSAIVCSGGQGLLNLFNVKTRGGGPNLGFGVEVKHGMKVLANSGTYTAADAAPGTELRGRDLLFPVASAGDGFTLAGGNVTLTDAAGTFAPTMVGRRITIAGATSAGNNGTFVIASVSGSGNSITYANALGVTELAIVGVTTWTLEGGDLQVGFLPIRTWTDFNNNPPLRNSFDVTAVGANGASGSGSQLIADPFVNF